MKGLVTHSGKTLTYIEWSAITGINPYTIKTRINKLHWSPGEALTTPYAIKWKKMYPRLYNTWVHIHQRCNNPNSRDFHHYGGRGIKVNKRWEKFPAFLWDMEPTYRPNLEIDRIDNNGPYSKENCQWATRKQQTNNTRTNHLITHSGTTMTINQWATKLSIPRCRIRDRIKLGWTVENALFAPKKKNKYV